MNFNETKVTLVLAPHPDDEALGCSGTMARLISNGSTVRTIYLTRGERLYGESSEEIASIRVEEANETSRLLNCKEAMFLGFPDGGLSQCINEVFKKLRAIIDEKRPDLVLSPSPVDYHHDHIATARAILQVMNKLRSFKLAFYEVYETIRFNRLIDVSDFILYKKRAILNYKRSLYDRPDVYVHAITGLNAQRSIYTERAGYYEAFLILDKPVDEKDLYDYLCYRRDDLT